jgi:hypothetical protein
VDGEENGVHKSFKYCSFNSPALSLYGILKLKNAAGGCVLRVLEEGVSLQQGALLTYAPNPQFTYEKVSVLGKIVTI